MPKYVPSFINKELQKELVIPRRCCACLEPVVSGALLYPNWIHTADSTFVSSFMDIGEGCKVDQYQHRPFRGGCDQYVIPLEKTYASAMC